MFRKLFYLVSVFMIVGLIGPVAAQEVDMEIGIATQPPVLDGQVDEIWADASTQYFVPLDDPANASGSWMALYDSENLYVIVDITDDSLQNDSADSWLDDSVEFYFDGGNTKVNTPLSGDDHQYTFGWTTDEIQGTNIEGYTEGIEHAQVDTDTGWRIEIKLPWLSMQGAAPQAGDLIGIDCFYNDDDDGGDTNEDQIWTFATQGGAWNDASKWGTAILAAIPIPKPVDPGIDGLVAHYAFENDANDSSGNGLDGVVVGDPNFVDGVEGMALDFDGDGDYVDCGNDPLFDITGEMTVSAWLNIRSIPTAWTGAVVKGENAWRLGNVNMDPRFHFGITIWNAPDTASVDGATAVGFDEWHHATGTFDGANINVYLDGVLDGSVPTTEPIGISTTNLFIGENSESPGRSWDGLIDEVKIYNRALSEGEIRYLAGYNLVLNPSFEEDEAILDDPDWYQWVTWNPAEGAGSNATIVDTESVDGARSLMIEPVGPENWHFIVLYMPIPVEVGASYTASFWAKAAEPRPLGVQFKATDNTVSWEYTDFQLTTEWAEYSLTADALNAEAKLEFMCAGVEVASWLDSVTVYKVADAPTEPPVTNLALNPSFEEDEDILDDSTWYSWCTWNPPEGAGSNATIVDTESVDGARSLRVEPVGTENGHFIVANISFPLEFGADYTFTFWAKAEAPRPLTVSFKAADNSVSWGFTDFELTTEWAEYSLTATAESDAGKLEFLCAAVEVPFWLDSVSAFKSGEAPPDDVPPLVPGENILVNGGFEDGVMDPWSTYGTVTAEVVSELTDATVPEAPIEGAYCLHVVVPEAGANSWDAGLQHAPHVFEAGKQYTMSAFVKSKAGTLDIHFKPERGADPWEGYNDTTFTMTEEWTEFSVTTGVIPEDVDPASITFHIAFAAGDFWVDDVKFCELVEE